MNKNNLATKNTTDFTVLEDGQAFISQRKAAELCGVAETTFRRYINGAPNHDVNQGVSAENLQKAAHHFSRKSDKALNALVLFAKAGAKAYIYHEAGYALNAVPQTMAPTAITLPTPTELAQMLIKSEEEKSALIGKIEELQIAGLTIVNELGSDLYFNVAAKILETNLGIALGHNTLMELLRVNGYLLMGTRSIYEKNMPSSKHVALFRVILFRDHTTGSMRHTTVIRPEGLAHIAPLVSGWLQTHINLKLVQNKMIPIPPPPAPKLPNYKPILQADDYHMVDASDPYTIVDYIKSGWTLAQLVAVGKILPNLREF